MTAHPAPTLPDDAVRGLELAVALAGIDGATLADAGDVLEVAARWMQLAAWVSADHPTTSSSRSMVGWGDRRPDDREDA